ncbi:hypothetical protein [Pontibacter sp. SGAir0037]|uniref:hypothetical protein n=1 Tax=Pontibacter sp. SGAir0037 TaxID=2571030 RepID=UPI0010CCDE2A|nr:hypothetical protein [Pontibacter sp. SGAir0037]QCR21541.1 hypothetical protein C1N53_03730 [Pontibacter sp. SGAir0037]
MEIHSLDISHFILLLLIGIYLVLVTFVLTWIYYDAERRGVFGWLIVPLVFFSGSSIIGALLWLLFRPKLKLKPVSVSV